VEAIYWIPVVTTVVAAVFATIVLRRYLRRRSGPHLLWWGLGLVIYGIGTLTEALTTMFGWNESVFRAWYISGALCGGAPLAQGTAYLLLRRRTANLLAVMLIIVIGVAAMLVVLSPIDYSAVEQHRLSGRVLGWQGIRMISPFINTYAAVFLIGGAFLSAWRFRRDPETHRRYVGNALIAIGAILPGIGGTFTRFGYVEVLYVTEFVGLLLIFSGYRLNVAEPHASLHASTDKDAHRVPLFGRKSAAGS
jgi:hypothetical protein